MKTPLLVIGGGLSGIAAAIRAARFIPDVLLLEKHHRLGGLNSYFYRHGLLFETGLHAITNYAEPRDKKAPLNRLLRQLKLPRDTFNFLPQRQSEILFHGCASLLFSNDFNLFQEEIKRQFPASADNFAALVAFLDGFDPFVIRPFRSTRQFLVERLREPLLQEMLLCPLLYYGSSHSNDIDLSQFAIMFRAIYQEGMFRPGGNIKEFLDTLRNHYLSLGGSLRTGCGVARIVCSGERVERVILADGEELECDYLLSTIGYHETLRLLAESTAAPPAALAGPRLGFIENIYLLKTPPTAPPLSDKTIIFYNKGDTFSYQRPDQPVDFHSGVICLPGNFAQLPPRLHQEIRSTHLASYPLWRQLADDPAAYLAEKQSSSLRSLVELESVLGPFRETILYENNFTPVTIERYTGKLEGAIYGNPAKIKDGDIGYRNLFLAGTDQGFLGIVGAMLSGVSIVNSQILPNL